MILAGVGAEVCQGGQDRWGPDQGRNPGQDQGADPGGGPGREGSPSQGAGPVGGQGPRTDRGWGRGRIVKRQLRHGPEANPRRRMVAVSESWIRLLWESTLEIIKRGGRERVRDMRIEVWASDTCGKKIFRNSDTPFNHAWSLLWINLCTLLPRPRQEHW